MRNRIFNRSLVTLALLAILGLGVYLSHPLSLLNYDDWMLEYENRANRPTISAALNDPNYWQSFSRWQCFENKTLSFHCAMADKKNPIPEVVVEDKAKEYVFGLEYAENYDCALILKAWKKTLDSSKPFCFFGAYLPTNNDLVEISDPSPTYLISRLKGTGYWDLDNLAFREEYGIGH